MTLLERLAAGHGLAVLVDPARSTASDARVLAERASGEGAAVLMVGNSFGADGDAAAVARALRAGAPELPVIQFPSSAATLVSDVDAVLLLSLVSGRNAQYLIDEHVRSVPFFDRHPHVEAISTAYCLIDGGRVTAVEAASQTRPLPSDKPEFVRAHVRAASLIGMQAAYLDAGSGARRPVPADHVRAARAVMRGPLFVGGGVQLADQVRAARDAGADYVVVGTFVERAGAPAVAALARAAS